MSFAAGTGIHVSSTAKILPKAPKLSFDLVLLALATRGITPCWQQLFISQLTTILYHSSSFSVLSLSISKLVKLVWKFKVAPPKL